MCRYFGLTGKQSRARIRMGHGYRERVELSVILVAKCLRRRLQDQGLYRVLDPRKGDSVFLGEVPETLLVAVLYLPPAHLGSHLPGST